MRFPPASALVLAALLTSSVLGLAALGGVARPLFKPDLSADIHVVEMAMPAEAWFDRTSLADLFQAQLLARAQTDVALRMALDENARRQLSDVIIPRLVNPSMTARMIEQSPALTTITQMSEFRSIASATVANDGDVALRDVAVTLPGVLRAQRRDGGALDVVQPDDGPGGVRLGALQPGEAMDFVAWLNLGPDEVMDLAGQVRVGAGSGVDGQATVFGRGQWYGHDLEAMPWARWLIGAVLTITALASAFGLAVMVTLRGPSVRSNGPARVTDPANG